MIRVVLDTNIYISAFLFGGKPAEILDLAEEGRITLYYSKPIRNEVEEVLAEKFRWSTDMIDLACEPLWRTGILVKPRHSLMACSDPDDDRILECAVEAQAECLVTGDKHLLEMARFENIAILRPGDYLQILTR